MAGKSTISITFKLDGDGKSFKDLANSADGFKGVIQATITESEQLKKSLINWSQGVQAISAITNTISSISSAFSSLSEKMKGLQKENILTTQLTGKTGEEMLKLRNSVKATADHFGTDFTETMQAVNALAKGFGITTEEAMKLMQDGFVSGANANGEFVDTLKEYPRYFKEAGLSAEEFIAITTNAAKQGIYSDKGVDVIKEGNLRIREMTKATAEALQGIGISAEKVQADLQNGSLTTFDVMQLVAGKLNELPANSAAVGAAIADIFGGPGEDAGLEYIKTLSTIQLNMDAVKAAAGSTAEQQERQIRIQENLKNSLSGLIDLSAIYSNVQPYIDLAAQAGTAAMGIGALVKTIKAMNVQQAITATRTAAVAVAQKAATAATTVWTGVQKILNLVLTANPIGLIVTAIGALVAAVIAAYNNCESFRKIVDGVWEAIKPLANAIMNGLAKAFEWLVEKCKEAWEWLKNILGLGGKKVEVAVNVSKPKAAPAIDLGETQKKYANAGSTPKAATPKAPKAAAPVYDDAATTLKGINDNIEVLRAKLQTASVEEAAAIKNAGKAVDNGPLWKEDASTIKDISDNIEILNKQPQTASIDEAAAINQQIDAWNAKADAIKNAGREAEKTGTSVGKSLKSGWGAIKGMASSVESITEALKGNGSAWQIVCGIVDGFIGLYEGIQTVIGIINLLSAASAAHAVTKGAEAGEVAAEAATRAASVATITTASTATIMANKLETASWKELAAAKYMAAHAAIPFAGYGIAAGFVAAMMATVTAAGVPMLANGGLATGPTLAMVGEYAGASGNPEVIAPLDKLRGLLAEPAAPIDFRKVEFRIKGRELVGILSKEDNLTRRS